MRWPWERVPWGRTRGVDDPATGGADTVPDATSPAPAPASPSGSGLPAAWTRLPPLQRSVADGTAVAPPAAFRSSLTTHQNPSLLAPLGHLVDPDGPAGVVGGVASSVGGPVPYEGVDELRVPERPTKPAAPAVQRRTATLQPMAAPEPDALDPGWTETGPTDVGVTDSNDATSTPPAPLPSLVQRSVSDPTQPTSATREVSTLVTPDPGRTADEPAPIPSAAPADPPPLTVPVQRALSSQSAVPVQRATSTSETASELRRPIGHDAPPNGRPTGGPPADSDALVVARSVAEPTTGAEPRVGVPGPPGPGLAEPVPPPGDDVVGLVADRTGRLTVTTPSTAIPSTPAVQRSGSNPPQPVPELRPTHLAPAGTPEPPSATVWSARRPTGPDERLPPPLVARSVQRTAAAHPNTTSGPAASPAAAPTSSAPTSSDPTSSDPSLSTAQAPLSPFSAAIAALRDAPEEPPVDPVTASEVHGAAREPDLVVARRVSPDVTGDLPPATGRVRPDSFLLREQQGRGPEPVQRSLIGGRPPVPTALDTLPTGTTIPPAPAVQRLRYDGATTTGGRQVEGPVSPPGPPGPAEVPIGPSSSDGGSWSVQRQSPGSGAGSVVPALAAARGDRSTVGELTPGIPSVPLELGSIVPAPSGFPTTSVASAAAETPFAATTPFAALPSSVSSAPAGDAGELPLVQRRSDAAASSSAGSAPLAPPASADPPAMAVSSRTVGLAEMFALAAAQPTDGVPVQRSSEPEVQAASVDTAPAPSAPSSSVASAAAPAPTGQLSGAELAEMARRLYEPLSARLRNELWQDRERAGLLTDLRP